MAVIIYKLFFLRVLRVTGVALSYQASWQDVLQWSSIIQQSTFIKQYASSKFRKAHSIESEVLRKAFGVSPQFRMGVDPIIESCKKVEYPVELIGGKIWEKFKDCFNCGV